MRSIRWLAAVTGTLVLGSACGGGDNVGPNQPPVASFTQACTNLVCTFDDTSTDDKGITSRGWTFGDPNSGSNTADADQPVHTFSAAGTYTVSLTVTDADGANNVKTNSVTVTAAPPVNAPPVAAFTSPSCIANAACSFTDASTDDVAVTGWTWAFGDGTPNGTTQNVSHTYTAAGSYQVTLTVTDGTTPASVTQTVTVTPPAAQACTATGTTVDCTLSVGVRSTVKLTLTGRECELGGSRLNIITPVAKLAFGNLCSKPIGEVYQIPDAAGAPLVFEAGTQLVIRFTQGVADPGDPAVGGPRANLQGGSPAWTISIDDGGNPTGAGEPDFTDVVVLVQATAL